MAQEIIKLSKNIISNKYSNEHLPKKFKDLAKSEEYIDEDKINRNYDKVFYNIPKRGSDNTHQYIIEQSHDRLFSEENDLLENEIDKLVLDLDELNKELTTLEIGDASKENELYEDGAFLMAGESPDQEPYQDMNTVWVMQEGRKRPIGDVEIYDTIRKSYDLIPGEKTGIYFLTIDELNLIPDGVGIHTYEDLNLKGTAIIAEDTDIQATSAYFTADFKCEGHEVADTYDIYDNTSSTATGQFYLTNGACTISYYVDNGTIDEIEPTLETLTISKDETVSNITFVRDTGVGNSAIPMDIDITYMDYPSTNWVDEHGYSVNYIKLWGPGKRYSGIVHVGGRVKIQEHSPIAESSWKTLSGVPTDLAQPGNYELVEGDTLNIWSAFGTKRLFPPGSNKHGALNQPHDLQNLFNNTSWYKYYYEKINYSSDIEIDFKHGDYVRLSAAKRAVTGRWHDINVGSYYGETTYLKSYLYGQPIIRWHRKDYDGNFLNLQEGEKYFVVVGMYNKQWTWPIVGGNCYHLKAFLLYDLMHSKIRLVPKSILGDAINLRMETSSGGRPRKVKWGELNTDAIAYVGHKGHNVLGYNTSGPHSFGTDNPFNPDNGGSNTFLNSLNTP
jgi:hypothetical protein